MRRSRPIALVLAALVVAGLAGCGATPPQAPLPEAQKLDTSLGAISTACGLSYQSTGLDPRARTQLGPLEAKAAAQARKLASVYRQNPRWIYQGETVSFIVGQALSTLGDCGLNGARLVLTRAVAKR